MKNKICFSKTLAYLVFFVAVLVGFLYLINVINTQKLDTKPQAAAKECRENGVKGTYTKKNCNIFSSAMGTAFHEYDLGNSSTSKGVKLYCCVGDKAGKKDKKVTGDNPSDPVTMGSLFTKSCQSLTGKVAFMFENNTCLKYTGKVNPYLKNMSPKVITALVAAQKDPDTIYCETGKFSTNCNSTPIVKTCSQICEANGGEWCPWYFDKKDGKLLTCKGGPQAVLRIDQKEAGTNIVRDCMDPVKSNLNLAHACCKNGCE